MDVYAKKGTMGNYLWRKIARLNIGESYSFIHSWGTYMSFNKYFKGHPEYYPLIKGKRKKYLRKRNKGNQVCTSNPAVAEIFAKRITSIYRKTKQDIIGISPNDGHGFCECAQCCALDQDKLYSATEVADCGGRCLSDRIFTFTNKVAVKSRLLTPKLKSGCFYTVIMSYRLKVLQNLKIIFMEIFV